MPSYSFPFNRGDVKYKLNELVSPQCSWINQDYTQFAAISGIGFESAIYGTLPNAGIPLYGVIRVSDNGDISIIGKYTTFGGSATIEIFRNSTIADIGTESVSTCYNLSDYEKTPHTKIYSGSSISDDGDIVIGFQVFGSTAVAGRVASQVSSESRRTLKAGEDYILKVTPDANGIKFQAFFEWAECYRIVENNHV